MRKHDAAFKLGYSPAPFPFLFYCLPAKRDILTLRPIHNILDMGANRDVIISQGNQSFVWVQKIAVLPPNGEKITANKISRGVFCSVLSCT